MLDQARSDGELIKAKLIQVDPGSLHHFSSSMARFRSAARAHRMSGSTSHQLNHQRPGKMGTLASEEEDEPVDGSVSRPQISRYQASKG